MFVIMPSNSEKMLKFPLKTTDVPSDCNDYNHMQAKEMNKQ